MAKAARKPTKKAGRTRKKKPVKKTARKAAKKTTSTSVKARSSAKKQPAEPPAPNKPTASPTSGTTTVELMQPPPSGVKVRMYRHGHGDCFLLAFRGSSGQPVYVLIDCGYKPGSNTNFGLADIGKVVSHIGGSTKNRLDLVIVTHEHQDHVNAFGKAGSSAFDPIEMSEAWFAWTEDPTDKLAIELRRRYGDQLLGLVAARNQLAVGNPDAAGYIDKLLQLELGVDQPGQFAAEAAVKAKDPEKSVNKQGMKLIKDKAGKRNTIYLRPHQTNPQIPDVPGVNVYVLGPPHDADLLKDENPQGSEAFPGQGISGRASFFAAADAEGNSNRDILPFSRRSTIPLNEAFADPQYGKEFFRRRYGNEKFPTVAAPLADECPDNPDWRRIDKDWLFSAEELALVLNKGINNTSVVLAFELQASKKVLLFVGDAQRGNWKSWTTDKKEHDKINLVRDLLGRTVLYKVGHHGSHNATLNGTTETDYPCLAWMGQGKYADEFTAMITAVNKWALAVKPPWVHPLPSIKAALHEKARGRVFQIDTPTVDKPNNVSAAEWKEFQDRVHIDPGGLFFDYEVHD